MTIALDHTIVWARDKAASAEFLAVILGVPLDPRSGPFVPIRLSNGVTLDYADAGDVRAQHCAFRLDEDQFDAAFNRIRSGAIAFYADPSTSSPEKSIASGVPATSTSKTPTGHNMELLTQPSQPDTMVAA